MFGRLTINWKCRRLRWLVIGLILVVWLVLIVMVVVVVMVDVVVMLVRLSLLLLLMQLLHWRLVRIVADAPAFAGHRCVVGTGIMLHGFGQWVHLKDTWIISVDGSHSK